jgi:hypothetical protein
VFLQAVDASGDFGWSFESPYPVTPWHVAVGTDREIAWAGATFPGDPRDIADEDVYLARFVRW